MFKNNYFKTAVGIYINYLILGEVIILLASHMTFLEKQFGTDAAGISFLITMEGLGRLATLYIIGRLSDKFGRKKFLCLSPIIMIIFLVGIPFAPSYEIAMALAICAGISNGFLDATSNPGLMECFPKTPGTATVLVRGFMSVGAALLPFIIAFFSNKNMFYGYTFFIMAIVLLLNGLFLLSTKFPDVNGNKTIRNNKTLSEKKFLKEPVFKKEGLALIVIGFTSNAISIACQTWMVTYGQQVLGMDQNTSLKLITYYSMGSLISVLILAILLSKILKPVVILLAYPIIGILSLMIILFIKTPEVTTISFFLMGVSSAGVLQMAQTTMGELFWENKGAKIALVSTASGIATALFPGLTGLIVRSYGVLYVFYLIIIVFAIAIVAAIFIKSRYIKLTKKDN